MFDFFDFKEKSNLVATSLALLIVAGQFVISPVQAIASSGKGKILSAMASPSDILVERTVDGTTFLQDMTEAANALKGYTCTYITTVYKGKKTIEQQGQFYFKQPRLMRVEMTGSYKRGAVAVICKDGKIRGHLGGALSPFTMIVSANSDLILGANGYPLTESDFASMASVMNSFVKDGCKVKVTDTSVAVEAQPAKVYVLEFLKSGQLYKRAYIDPKSLLPVEWFDYQDGKLFAHTTWKNVKEDLNIADAVFQL
jgi:outer membrane lipoprotein-sorting protein